MCAPRVYSLEVEKRGLSAYDNKRYLLGDGEHTLAFGHHAIPEGAVDLDENVPMFDDERIETRIPLDRAPPPPVRTPEPPRMPDDPLDYTMLAARTMEIAPPPPEGIERADYELLHMQAWDALRRGRDEAEIRELVQNALDLVADNAAFVVATLDVF